MTTPEERVEHVYDATIWQYLDNVLRGDPVVKQEMIRHIAAEIRESLPRWMSASECLPDLDTEILISTPNEVMRGVYSTWPDEAHFVDDRSSWIENVIGWQPLPPPMKAEAAHD